MATRPFHVVIWGASGFTGRLVCEHVARDYKGQIKWAMAGRDRERLEKVRLELSQTYGEDLKDVPILLGDLSDQSSLDAIARDTNCLISTAGPFVRLGAPIVDAAVRMGSHYVDITGESPYVMHLIKTYQEAALAKKVRIVPCCGFDSIPSDLGAFLVVDYIKKEFQKRTAKVVTAIRSAAGGFSGGTIASAMELRANAASKGYPSDTGVYSFLPPGAPKGDDKEFWGAEWEPTLGKWLGPFFMQVINSRVVHRSAYMLGYGPDFHYQEAIQVRNWWAAQALALGSLAMLGAVISPWLQPLLKKVLPAPGQGPTREAMLSGHYTIDVVGYSAEEEGTEPVKVVAEVSDKHRDGGYWGTSRMLLEAALCLALQQQELDAAGLPQGGVLTPATAMGTFLIDRLRAAGITYVVKRVAKPE